MASSDNSTSNAYLPLYISVNNFAPIFEAGPPPTEIVEFDTESSYTYKVPASLDIEGDDITILLSGLKSWMEYDEVN